MNAPGAQYSNSAGFLFALVYASTSASASSLAQNVGKSRHRPACLFGSKAIDGIQSSAEGVSEGTKQGIDGLWDG